MLLELPLGLDTYVATQNLPDLGGESEWFESPPPTRTLNWEVPGKVKWHFGGEWASDYLFKKLQPLEHSDSLWWEA